MPLRILIVDDEAIICENLQDILEERGHEVHWNNDPEEALKRLSDSTNGEFDVAILDFKMPGMSGVELLEKIRSICPGIVAILITAFSDFIDSRVDDFNQVLEKPLQVESLLGLLDGLTPLILCVDDDQQFCDSMLEIFEHKGVAATFAHDVKNAKQILTQNAFDVVLVDFQLPDGKGSETIRDIKNILPDTKTILITGYPDQLDGSLDSEFQPDATFLKPIDPEKLLNAIFKFAKP